MDDLMDTFPRVLNNGSSAAFYPAVDVIENKEGISLTLDLPGVKKEDISINVKDGTLVVSGEKKKEQGKGSYTFSERPFGKFERSFKLANRLDADSISAKYEDGILEVSIAVKEENKPKSIVIK